MVQAVNLSDFLVQVSASRHEFKKKCSSREKEHKTPTFLAVGQNDSQDQGGNYAK
jgi:hypothetical protein